MATKKTKRRATPGAKKTSRKKASGSAFPAMSDLMTAIEDNFRALAAMMPTGSTARPKRKTKAKTKRRPASRAKTAVKRAAGQGKRAVARSKKAVRKTMPKKPAAKRTRRADKRPSAVAPI